MAKIYLFQGSIKKNAYESCSCVCEFYKKFRTFWSSKNRLGHFVSELNAHTKYRLKDCNSHHDIQKEIVSIIVFSYQDRRRTSGVSQKLHELRTGPLLEPDELSCSEFGLGLEKCVLAFFSPPGRTWMVVVVMV